MTPRGGQWHQVYTGRQFWPADPRANEVTIEDIAHSLAHQCRFGGHCEQFYSVAQHSVLVSLECNPTDAMAGLLHDAAEAYVVDVPRPLKRMLRDYAAIEASVHAAICDRFGLAHGMPASVKHADEVLLATEARDLMKRPPVPWEAMPLPRSEFIAAWSCADAKLRFLARFYDLGGLR